MALLKDNFNFHFSNRKRKIECKSLKQKTENEHKIDNEAEQPAQLQDSTDCEISSVSLIKLQSSNFYQVTEGSD